MGHFTTLPARSSFAINCCPQFRQQASIRTGPGNANGLLHRGQRTVLPAISFLATKRWPHMHVAEMFVVFSFNPASVSVPVFFLVSDFDALSSSLAFVSSSGLEYGMWASRPQRISQDIMDRLKR